MGTDITDVIGGPHDFLPPMSDQFQKLYFSYIAEVSFIGRGNKSMKRKSTTCRKSLTNFITYCCMQYTSPEWDSNSQR
jgi:hypothetical protein